MKSHTPNSTRVYRSSILALGTVACAWTLCGPALAKQKITTIDPPDSIATYAWSLNEKGVVTGFYYDSRDKTTKGFVRSSDGTIATFEHGKSKVTAAYGIDARGRVTGYWSTPDGEFPGFIRESGGKLKHFHVPGDVSGTFPVAMTAQTAIAGSWYDAYSIP